MAHDDADAAALLGRGTELVGGGALAEGLAALSEAAQRFEARGRAERLLCYLAMADAVAPTHADGALALLQRVWLATEHDASTHATRFARHLPARGMAEVLAARGERDAARAWLDRALEALALAPADDPAALRYGQELAALREDD